MKFKLIIQIGISISLLMPLGAQATPITNIAISGTGSYSIYELPVGQTTGILTIQPPTLSAVKDVLMFSTRVGNVQLGTPVLPNAQTNMTVTFTGGSQAIFSNILKTDWTDNSFALVHNYITAAGNSVLMTLTQSQLDDATNHFLNIAVLPGIYAWQLASDPSIAAINLVNGHIIVGQDGLFNPVNYLNTLFAGTGAPPAPSGSQASEVVKVIYDGSTQYLYSFSATSTGYSTDDKVSYTGRYTAETIPEPATLLLLGIGFIGLTYMRNHKKRDVSKV